MSDDSNERTDSRFELNRRRLMQAQTGGLLGFGLLDTAVGDADASTVSQVTILGSKSTTVGASESYTASVAKNLEDPTYVWKTSGEFDGDGDGASVSITFDSAGTHSVSVTVSEDGGFIVGHDDIGVTVEEGDGGSEPLSVELCGPTNTDPDPTTYTANVANASGSTSFDWQLIYLSRSREYDLDDNDDTVTVDFGLLGSWGLAVTVSDDDETVKESLTIEVEDDPGDPQNPCEEDGGGPPEFSLSIDGDWEVLNGSSNEYEGVVDGAATVDEFTWSVEADSGGEYDLTGETQQTATIEFRATDSYQVDVQATSNGGVTRSASRTVDVVAVDLQLNDVRPVQTVEKTTLHESDEDITAPSTPDLASDRETSVVFDLEGSEYLEYLPDDEVVDAEVERRFADGSTSTGSLELPASAVASLAQDPDSDAEVFADRDASEQPPVFQAGTDLEEITVTLSSVADDGAVWLRGDDHSIEVGQDGDVNVREMDTTVLGFVHIADPAGGDNYGGDDGSINLNFGDLVEQTVDYLEWTHPTNDVEVYSIPEPLDDEANVNTDCYDGSHMDDLESAQAVLEDEFDADFDETMAFVPEGYFGFHSCNDGIGPGILGIHLEYMTNDVQPRTASVTTAQYGPWVATYVAAQEMGHHFLPQPPLVIQDPASVEPYPEPMARRANGSLDHHHARTEPDSTNVTNDEDFLESTGYYLLGGEYRYIVESPVESFMSYNLDEVPWSDTQAYQLMLEGGLEPDPPLEEEGSQQQAIISGTGRVTDDGEAVITRMRRQTGRPTRSSVDGEIAVDVTDDGGTSLDSRAVPDTVRFSALQGNEPPGDEPGDGISGQDLAGAEGETGAFTFAVPFPPGATEIRTERDGNVATANPVSGSVQYAVERLPDAAFEKEPEDRRQSLLDKLDAIDNQMGAGAFHAAAKKMTKDVRDKVEKWLHDQYDAGAGQPTKTELLDLVDEMIDRLVQLSDRPRKDEGEGDENGNGNGPGENNGHGNGNGGGRENNNGRGNGNGGNNGNGNGGDDGRNDEERGNDDEGGGNTGGGDDRNGGGKGGGGGNGNGGQNGNGGKRGKGNGGKGDNGNGKGD